MTERQAIVQHFAENKVVVQKPVDMSLYLARDKQQRRPALAGQKEYVEKVLKAGYTSKMSVDLFNDIVEAQKQQPKAKAEKSE
jgi:hypothetical protein